MPGDDGVVLSDQHRVGPAPFLDRGRDLIDLCGAVGAGIARIRNEPLDRPALYLVGGPDAGGQGAGRVHGSPCLFAVEDAVGWDTRSFWRGRHVVTASPVHDDALDRLTRLRLLLEL